MGIDLDCLITWGGVIKKIPKKEIIFREDSMPSYYYQIISGKVSLFNIDDHYKEFIQGVFIENESFGEPPLFINEPYPSTAITVKDSIIIKVPKQNFFDMVQKMPSLQMHFIKILATRVYLKSMASKNLITNDAETRIINFLNSFKKTGKSHEKVLILHTRQEIANLTGLRVETVIRTLKKLQEQSIVQITDHKLYY